MANKSKLIAICDGDEVEITHADSETGKAFVTRLGDPSGYERYVDFSQLDDVRVVGKDHATHYGKPHFMRFSEVPQQIVDRVIVENGLHGRDYHAFPVLVVRDHPGITTAPGKRSGGQEAMKKPAEQIIQQ